MLRWTLASASTPTLPRFDSLVAYVCLTYMRATALAQRASFAQSPQACDGSVLKPYETDCCCPIPNLDLFPSQSGKLRL